MSLLYLKINLLFFPEFPKILTHYSYFIPISSPIIPNYSCNIYISMTIKDHNTHGDLCLRTGCCQCNLLFKICMKYCYLHVHLHRNHHFNNLRDYFITFTHCNIQLFLHYACECPIIPELFSIKLQPIILKIMPAY